MKLLYWLLVIVIGLIVVVFAINNRQMVGLDLWPLAYDPALPVFAIALIGIFIGFIWGGIVAWVSAGRSRQRARDYRRRIESDQREMAVLRRRIEKMENAERDATIPPPPQTPAMPGASTTPALTATIPSAPPPTSPSAPQAHLRSPASAG